MPRSSVLNMWRPSSAVYRPLCAHVHLIRQACGQRKVQMRQRARRLDHRLVHCKRRVVILKVIAVPHHPVILNQFGDQLAAEPQAQPGARHTWVASGLAVVACDAGKLAKSESCLRCKCSCTAAAGRLSTHREARPSSAAVRDAAKWRSQDCIASWPAGRHSSSSMSIASSYSAEGDSINSCAHTNCTAVSSGRQAGA